MIDTHTHLYLDDFNPDKNEVVKRAIDAGVNHLIFPNVDLGTVEPMLALHERFPKNTSVAMGLHPTEVKETWRQDLDLIGKYLDDTAIHYVAVGEIGIDLYWDKTFRDEQMEVFGLQVEWAVRRDLPVIIHCREGLDEILEVFESSGTIPRGVFHSFGGSEKDVERIRRIGDFYFGINGIVTFKNSNLRDILPAIGIDRILLETDSPYLAPVPRRGKRNESAFLTHIAAAVGNSLNLPIDEIDRITTQNATALFGLK